MNKRIAVILVIALVIMSFVDFFNLANVQEVYAEDLYTIIVNNFVIVAVAGFVIFLLKSIMSKKNKSLQ